MRDFIRTGLLLLFVTLLVSPPVTAHDGPPFPLIVDQQVGPWIVSVWTDPDVGTGTFFVIPSAPPGTTVPDDLKVQVSVQPVSGRLPETTYQSEREALRDHVQFKSVVQFDAQEMWRVRVRLSSAQGEGEAVATVEATPPGLGRWDLLVYLLPFLAIGFLWLVAFVRKRQRAIETR
jgi:hypothetical protein